MSLAYGLASPICPHCQREIESSAGQIFCPQCGTAHHPACWQANQQQCAVPGCTGATTPEPVPLGPDTATPAESGPVGLQRIASFDILSLAKIMTILYAFLGLIYGLVIAAVMALVGIFASLDRSLSSSNIPAFLLGPVAIVVAPLLFAFIGFMGGVLFGALYNLVARWIGGMEFEGAPRAGRTVLRGFKVLSVGKVFGLSYALLGAIAGVLGGGFILALGRSIGHWEEGPMVGLLVMALLPLGGFIGGFLYMCVYALFYNLVALTAGGLEIEFTAPSGRAMIQSIDILSMGKVSALLGILGGVIQSLLSLTVQITTFVAAGPRMEGSSPAGAVLLVGGLISLVFGIILAGVLGFLGGIILAAIYNMVARGVGGIVVGLEKAPG